MSMPPSVLHAHSIAGGWDRRGPFLDTCSVRPAAPVAQPVPQPPRTPVARPAPAPAPSKGTLVAAHQSVYIWEDMGRKHNGVQIYKIGVATTHCSDGTCGVKRRMNEVARKRAATPKLIYHVPAHKPFDVENMLKCHGGEVPGITDGWTEFRTFTPAQVKLCITIMESHRATGLAPPPKAKLPTLPKDPRKRRAEIRRRRGIGAWYNDPVQLAAIQARKDYGYARHDLFKQLAEEHLRVNFKPGLIFNRTFEGYRGQRLDPHVEREINAQVDARFPLGGA